MTPARLFGVALVLWLGACVLGCGRSDLLSWDSPGEYPGEGSGSIGSSAGSSGESGSRGGDGGGSGASGAERGDARAPEDAAPGSQPGAHSGSSVDGSSDDAPAKVFTGDDSAPLGDGSTCGAACPGCCRDGLCVSGLQELACGRGGGTCSVCSAELSCAYGFCQ